MTKYFKSPWFRRAVALAEVLLLLGGIYWFGFRDQSGGYIKHGEAKQHQLISFTEERDPVLTNNYISIAQLSSDRFVIANYVNLLLFDRKKSAICRLDADFSVRNPAVGLRQIAGAGVYNPTGVAFDRAGRLYVANYKGNNILVFDVDTNECRVKFRREFKSPNSGGPENVALDPSGEVVVSANYDAGTVTAFATGSGAELWSTPIAQAHGVALVGERVFVTGLAERKIHELSLSSGKIVRSVGSLGWDPMKSQFLWPTSVSATPAGELLVSDAHTGFISVLDGKTLKTRAYTGGSGPSYAWFNYPYAAISLGNEIVVLSSMRGHILFLEAKSFRVDDSFLVNDQPWPQSAKAYARFGGKWADYIDQSVPRGALSINGEGYKLGYGHLHPVAGGPILRMSDSLSLFRRGPYLYFLQGGRLDEVSYFFSSSGTVLYLLKGSREFPDLIATQPIPLDSWLHEGRLVSKEGELSVADLISRSAPLFSAMQGVLSKHGWIDRSAFLANWTVPASYYGLKDADSRQLRGYVEQLFSSLFVSAAGREYYKVYNGCSFEKCQASTIREAAGRYFYAVSRHAHVNFDEYMAIAMLSGVRPDRALELLASEIALEYSDCKQGTYHPGHGLNALQKADLSIYLAAYNLATSVVCMKPVGRKDGSKPLVFQFGWFDVPNVPKSFDLIELDASGKELQTVQVRSPQYTLSDGLPYTSVQITPREASSEYMLRLVEGGAQSRLLLRSALLK